LSAEADDIVVLSANLWHDWPRHRRLQLRLETFARMVESEGANVVLLQEVARTADVWVDRWLAERLGMGYLYSRVNGHNPSIGFEEGLAVFARFPLLRFRTRRLSSLAGLVHRFALGAQLESGVGPLWFFSVHLGLLRRANALQLCDLQRWVNAVSGSGSAVVGGDFNAHESAPQMLRARRMWLDLFRRINPHADGTTHEIRWPWGKVIRRRRLDYLFLRGGEPGWRVIESRHLEASEEPHSDHRAVVARLRPALHQSHR
jgi:endonuclease/exonuclease/phosphatase family metal-dependent hydrolase